MITRSKLVEQLRDYQIRSQHKRDIIGAVSWGLLLCFLIISSYLAIYFRHFKLSAAIIFLGITEKARKEEREKVVVASLYVMFYW
ncbi:hypothetical protein FCM35_KLT01438 [Carex littledalei]|uniref:Uncharacterized protein n=1 Tax=Carex littledalei TaxID=544730 RepID=A0A833VCC4_9POAL|nr:hypothetical protein FCM35_KLT01438 [Carex littledalei]